MVDVIYAVKFIFFFCGYQWNLKDYPDLIVFQVILVRVL